MGRNLPAKAAKELDRYRRTASLARRKSAEAPMKCAVKGAQVSVAAAGLYGAARTRIDALDSPIAEGAVAIALGAYGMMTGSPWALHAGTGIACVTAHELAQDLTDTSE